MKFKHLFISIALTLFCAMLAFTQSANDLLAQGFAAEQKGDNIQALTFYIQAHTADKSLTEAENRMNKMLEIVADGKFGIDTNSDNVGVKSQNLIRLRNEWDKLLLAATELIASNPPLFEAYYFNNVVPQPMKEEDYNNNTMSFTVSAPYLRPFYAPENNEIVHILSATLKKIEGHDVWGAKINGFPNTYFESTTGDNWLKTEKEDYDFQVLLFDNSKKQLASKKIKYTVNYKGNFQGISIESDLTGKFGKDYFVGHNADLYISEGEIEQILFNKVSMENVDSTSFLVTAKYAGKADLKIPVTTASVDVAHLYSADPKNHKKIVGNLSARSYGYYGDYTWLRVVDQLETKFTSIDMSEAYGLYELHGINGSHNSVKNIVIPDGCESIEKKSLGKFEKLETLTIPTSVIKIDPKMFDFEYRGIVGTSGKELRVVNYRGSERQWKTIDGHNNFGNVKINYLYEVDKIKKEYITLKETILPIRHEAQLVAEEETKKAEEEAKKAEEERIVNQEKRVLMEGLSVSEAYEYIQRNANSKKLLTVKIIGKMYPKDFYEILRLLQSIESKVYLDLADTSGMAMFYQNEGGARSPYGEIYQLVGITFPSTTYQIGDWLFEKGKLKTIVIPNSVKKIHFTNKSASLSKIIYKGTISQWEKINFEYSDHIPCKIFCTDAILFHGEVIFNKGSKEIYYTTSSYIAIPKTVTTISRDVLKKVRHISYEGTKKDWKNIYFDKDTKALLKTIKIEYDKTDYWK